MSGAGAGGGGRVRTAPGTAPGDSSTQNYISHLPPVRRCCERREKVNYTWREDVCAVFMERRVINNSW